MSLLSLPSYILRQLSGSTDAPTYETVLKLHNADELTLAPIPEKLTETLEKPNSEDNSFTANIDLLGLADWASTTWNNAIGLVATKVLGLPFEFPVYDNGIIIVTGAGSLIGFHAAKTLALKGFTVVAGLRTEQEVVKMETWITAQKQSDKPKINLLPIILDITSDESIKQAVTYVENLTEVLVVSTNGNLENLKLIGVVNCEATSSMGPLELMSHVELTRAFQVNAGGMVRLVQGFLPLLRASKGRVVNLYLNFIFIFMRISVLTQNIKNRSSSAGLFAANGSYAASKMALEALSDSMRLELFKWGISVSIIEPGAVDPRVWLDASGKENQNHIPLVDIDDEDESPHLPSGRRQSIDTRGRNRNLNSNNSRARSTSNTKSLLKKNEPTPLEGKTPVFNEQASKLAPLYMPMMQTLADLAREHSESLGDKAPSARPTTRAITHALFAQYPMTRYLCGWNAKVAAAVKWAMPDRIIDMGFQTIMMSNEEEDKEIIGV
ncbi:hypothetical protein HDU92_001443, partial [Lobulomyces angularis]